MINETCNFLLNNVCLDNEINKNIVSNFHFYIAIGGGLLLFFGNMFGSRIRGKKEEKRYYGLMIFLSIIAFFLYNGINASTAIKTIVLVESLVFFCFLSLYLSNFINKSFLSIFYNSFSFYFAISDSYSLNSFLK